MRLPFRRNRRKAPRQRTPAQTVRQNVVYGVVTITFLVVIVYLIFGLPVPWSNPRLIHVIAPDAGAIRVANATKVRVAGVNVGRVSGLKSDPGHPGFSEVTLQLDPGAPVIHKDATVKIRPNLFLEGNFFFDMSPGTADAPKLGSGTLPPSAVSLHVAADEVFTTFNSNTRTDAKGALRGLSEALDVGARPLNLLIRSTPPALSDLAVVGRALQGRRSGDLAKTIRGAGNLLAVLDRNEAGLQGTISNGRRTFDAIAASQDDLRRTFVGLDDATRRALPSLASINAAIPDTRALVRDAGPLVRRLPRTLDLANPALTSTLNLARSGDVQSLLADLRPTLRDLSATVGPLGTALADLRPVTQCVRNNVTPVLKSKVPDGALSTGMPVYRELASGLVGVSSTSQNFDANGPMLRYRAGLLGNQLLSLGTGITGTQTRMDEPLMGSNPPKPARIPPFRGDVPCETQKVPDLNVRAAPIRGTQRNAPIDSRRLAKETKGGLSALKKMSRMSPAAVQSQLRSLLGPPSPGAKDAGAAATAKAKAMSAADATSAGEAGR